MIIANPLYDVIFKFLLADMEIVRELLSVFVGEEIVSADLKPQELLEEGIRTEFSILRVDFKAVVKISSGDLKTILIELQKAKQALDVIRFRRYLGDNYRREEDLVAADGKPYKAPLPITTIYILGFRLDNIQRPAVKINREYRDAITNELLEVKEDFVELLTHDSYLIQVPRLQRQTRTKLERVLQVFSQNYRTGDRHQLDFQGDSDDPLVRKMINRLAWAIADDSMRARMDLEDEIERKFNEKEKILAEERERADAESARADAEAATANREKAEKEAESARADREKAEKETEKQRADDLQRRLDDLENRLKN